MYVAALDFEFLIVLVADDEWEVELCSTYGPALGYSLDPAHTLVLQEKNHGFGVDGGEPSYSRKGAG